MTRVDVRTMELDTDPAWAPITMYSVNLLKVNGHTHGNKRYYKAEGPTFVPFDDAVVLMNRVLEHFGVKDPSDPALAALQVAERALTVARKALTARQKFETGWRVDNALSDTQGAIWSLQHPLPDENYEGMGPPYEEAP